VARIGCFLPLVTYKLAMFYLPILYTTHNAVGGNVSDSGSLKIVVNGAFGKLGSKWSALYDPESCPHKDKFTNIMFIFYCFLYRCTMCNIFDNCINANVTLRVLQYTRWCDRLFEVHRRIIWYFRINWIQRW
jgi:hypothetical protein